MLEAAKEEIPALPLLWGESVLSLAADPALLENCIGPKSQLAENSRQGFELRSSTLRWATSEVKSRTALGMRGTLYDERIRSRCTGKERDSETCGGSTLCVDYFGARHYSSALGRFMTPDWSEKPVGVPYANFGNPQSLNLYSYVNNNPTTTRDPDGHGLIDVQSLVNSAISWLSSSHSASASVGVDAGHSVDKAGPVTITSKALYADASGSASYASSGVKVSAQAGVGVVSEKATEGSIGTTSIKATSADAEAHAGVSLTGASAGAGANADVLSATQTVKLGVVTLSATGNVGIGAEASASASTTGLSASAGITPGFGGAVSVSVNFGQGSVSGGASAQSTNTGTGIKTTVDKPQVK